MTFRGGWLTTCLVLGLVPGFAHAAAAPQTYQQVSRAFGMPSGLLYAIALTESGRQGHDGQALPWPWTLNVSGTPHYYPTRSAACHALSRLIASDRLNIDIGLMQINWRWHHTQLVTPCRALSPSVNLRVAARLLSHRYRQSHDWWIATGRYHDPGRDNSSVEAAWAYRGRVLDHWRSASLTTAAMPTTLIWITGRKTSLRAAARLQGQ